MKKLPESLVNKASKYCSLLKKDRIETLDKLYNKYKLSWAEAAKICGTYPNKLRRDAKSFGFKSRSKSEAQSLALESGRHGHPTKGKGHSESTKVKISESVAADWENMTDKEREKKREEARERWNAKSEEEIKKIRDAAGEGVRKAAKEGSALEHYLLKGLIAAGYKVDFHKEQWVIRDRLQIDLFLPNLGVAIEVDGPSHFENIWGEENLQKNKKRDNEKTGLLLERGYVIIRVRQKKSLSKKYKRDILSSVLVELSKIKESKPKQGKRHIVLGE